VTAATAAKIQPLTANSAPNASEPATEPWSSVTAKVTRPSTRLAAAVVISAAANCAWRPTTVAPSNSERPASSSTRVCRMTVSRAHRPIITGTKPARQLASTANESPRSRPYSATKPALSALTCA
jgi:hypothetical protein